ncbi:MAG: tetratricopeptide repeat protein [Verrucomicrobiota bacterium]
MKRTIRRIKRWFGARSWIIFGVDLRALHARVMDKITWPEARSRKIKRRIRIFKSWFGRRQWKLVWPSLPALLALSVLGFVALEVLSIRHQRDAIQIRYQDQARAALAAGNFEAARVASLRGLAAPRTERERADWMFYLALSLNGLGRTAEAANLLSLASPLDHPGSPEGHVMQAQSLLDSTNRTPEILRNAERHLLNAVAMDAQSPAANEMLGRFYINTRKYARARVYLSKIYPAKPDAALLLAACFDLEKNASSALLWAERAIPAIRDSLSFSGAKSSSSERLSLLHALAIKAKYAPLPDPIERAMLGSTNAAPQDAPAVWLDLARTLLKAEKYSSALETLDRAAIVSPNPAYSAIIADVCVVWARKFSTSQNAERLKVIQKGLASAPLNYKLRWLLIQASHASDDSGAAAQKSLSAEIAASTGLSAAWWQYLLAADCRGRGDLPAGHQHLQSAYELAPDIPEIQNDMAFELLDAKPPDPSRALKLIQSALEKFPDSASFRDTRGRVLFRLGRYAEAAADLSFAAIYLTGTDARETLVLLTKANNAMGRNSDLLTKNNTALDDISRRIGQVRGLMIEGKYAAALDALERGMAARPSPTYASVIADVCATYAGQIPPAQTNGAAERLRVIQKGLGQMPEHPKLRALLVQAAGASEDGAPAAKKLLDKLVAAADGDSAAGWQLLLGREARRRGDAAAARRYFQAACRLGPYLAAARYELAALLTAGNRADWEQGLQLMNPLVDEFPTRSDYRQVRGLLLVGLGRNAEAAQDLRFAADHIPHSSQLRLTLAKVYDALGKPQSAKEQRMLAEMDN